MSCNPFLSRWCTWWTKCLNVQHLRSRRCFLYMHSRTVGNHNINQYLPELKSLVLCVIKFSCALKSHCVHVVTYFPLHKNYSASWSNTRHLQHLLGSTPSLGCRFPMNVKIQDRWVRTTWKQPRSITCMRSSWIWKYLCSVMARDVKREKPNIPNSLLFWRWWNNYNVQQSHWLLGSFTDEQWCIDDCSHRWNRITTWQPCKPGSEYSFNGRRQQPGPLTWVDVHPYTIRAEG